MRRKKRTTRRHDDAMLRIESADFDAAGDGIAYLPLYAGRRKMGCARIEKSDNEAIVSLSTAGTNGEYALTLKQARRAGNPTCLQCPKCKEWRKRLFLDSGVTDSSSIRLVCGECAPASE